MMAPDQQPRFASGTEDDVGEISLTSTLPTLDGPPSLTLACSIVATTTDSSMADAV